ncbi:MAG: nodulation protein NfeD [Ignavibacteriales bacterium]|nr:nodulation protein NfeD [Ignavibacteriales bacterium]
MYILKLVFISFLLIWTNLFSEVKKVYVLTIDGTINPASADYIKSGIATAVEDNAECLIIKLNTPGGLLKSTRVIVTELLKSPIPIIVYVSPSGSQAASAGVFVTLAAHIAAMAPGTNIGAAHPVTLEGKMDTVMMEKATNDAAAFIKTISENRKRNIKWAEDAVRKSVSITETEALKDSVVNLIAANLNELLIKIDGQEVETVKGKKILKTANATIIQKEMSFQQKILDLLSDPNIAYILFMIGFYGILFELYNPGAIFPGVVGVIALILAFYSLHTLPVNYAGLALIIFAIILFVLEIKIVSHGLLSVGGTISLILGSIMLINSDSFFETTKISWEVIFFVVLFTVLFFSFAIGMGIKAQKRKPVTGVEGIIGEIGETLTDLTPQGKIRVHGEIWSAESIEGNLGKGEKVVVAEIFGLKLRIRKSI